MELKKTIHEIIAGEIPTDCRVLDMGCGDGDLLNYLIKNKNVVGHGIDINPNELIRCIEKGIPAIQLDLDNLPLDFSDKSYDVVILNQTIQQTMYPKNIVQEMLRIGKEGILGFSNFGSIDIRIGFLLKGKMPVTRELPYKWYNTPNIHLLTTKDFIDFCKSYKIKIIKTIFLKRKIFSNKYKKIYFFRNLRSDLAVFKITNIE